MLRWKPHSRCSKDLADSFFELSPFEFKPELCVYSLRSLRISTDHPFELFTLLFKIAPLLQHIQLIQTYDSSLKWKSNTQLYDCINFVIYQCQERLKCLRRLHIQLRSVSDQVRMRSFSLLSVDLIASLGSRYFSNRLPSHRFLFPTKSFIVRKWEWIVFLSVFRFSDTLFSCRATNDVSLSEYQFVVVFVFLLLYLSLSHSFHSLLDGGGEIFSILASYADRI